MKRLMGKSWKIHDIWQIQVYSEKTSINWKMCSKPRLISSDLWGLVWLDIENFAIQNKKNCEQCWLNGDLNVKHWMLSVCLEMGYTSNFMKMMEVAPVGACVIGNPSGTSQNHPRTESDAIWHLPQSPLFCFRDLPCQQNTGFTLPKGPAMSSYPLVN
jgi:hypothetical protein